MDADLEALESLYTRNRRVLHWAGFLLAMMGLILIIDLQLKKSIARQAVNAARLFSEAVAGYGPGTPGASGDPGAADGGADRVDGTARLAEDLGYQPRPPAGEAGGGVDGTPQRSRRDGGRAGGSG